MIFPLPITTTIGNPDAMANTNPDVIKAYNGLVLDDNEPYGSEEVTFTTLPLCSPPFDISRSFENCDRRPHWINIPSKKAPFRSPSRSRCFGDPSASVVNRSGHLSHPLWSINSVNTEMIYEYYLRRKNIPSYVPVRIYFLATDYISAEYTFDNGYCFKLTKNDNRDLALEKRVAGTYITLHEIVDPTNPFATMPNVFHKVRIVITPSNINIFLNDVLKLTTNDVTFRNGIYFGFLMEYGTSTIRWYLDDLRIY